MRKIVLMMSVSLDGFFEGENGDLDWHKVDDELHRHFNKITSRMGGFLSGRVLYELMAKHWPTADQDPRATKPVADFARIWRDMPKVVFSRTLERADWNARVVREVVRDEIQKLKEEPGGDLSLGGAELARTFRQLDLVDEYRLYVHPVLLGRGRPLFHPSDERRELVLAETRAFGNGVVLVRYQRP